MNLQDERYTVLNKEELKERLTNPDRQKRIFVVPMVNLKKQIDNGSLDLRLGTDFITTKRTRFSVVDPLERGVQTLRGFQSQIVDYQEKVHIDVGNKLILHPNQLVLGCTMEYLRLPNDLAAYVVGRSSWGRLGLIIATATFVHPSYIGVVTLEMANLGDAPIALYPGARITQLVFHLAKPEGKSGKIPKTKYALSTRPSFSKLAEDPEWAIIAKLQEARRKLDLR
jgi:dCTP deaminase